MRHCHDASGLECVAVVHLRDGTYGLVEVKIGGQPLIEKGVSTLVKLAEKIDTDATPAASLTVKAGL